MNLEYRVVDAFTSQPFQGNPAAVVFGGDELSDTHLQQIAAEFNLSETVFLLRPTSPFQGTAVRLRWFTPQCEVSFCGHASLAAVHAFCERLIGNASTSVASVWNTGAESPRQAGPMSRRSVELPSEIGVQCAAGDLTVKIDTAPHSPRRYWLSMPRPDTQAIDFSMDLLKDALHLTPDVPCDASAYRTRDRDVILFLSDGRHLRSLSPDLAKLDRLSRQHDVRGVSIASTDTGDAQLACISRFFAPAAGIAEDPVTGSVHGPLAALLINRSHVPAVRPDEWSFLCRQMPRNGRVGDVHIRAVRRGADLAVEIGGACVTVMAGLVISQ